MGKCRQSLPRVNSPRWSLELCLRGTADKKGIRLYKYINTIINVVRQINPRLKLYDNGTSGDSYEV